MSTYKGSDEHHEAVATARNHLCGEAHTVNGVCSYTWESALAIAEEGISEGQKEIWILHDPQKVQASAQVQKYYAEASQAAIHATDAAEASSRPKSAAAPPPRQIVPTYPAGESSLSHTPIKMVISS